ncbi:MAG: 6-hydroxymethylpterin diphosphokinase MptE-like protein [Ignisphaera sp.]
MISVDLWREIYSYVKSKLKLSFDLDQVATDTLSNILSNMGNTSSIETLKNLLNFDTVVVIAPGPNLEKDFEKASKLGFTSRYPVVAVDGASSYLLEIGFKPAVIVTDLDGDPRHILALNESGSFAVVHAHGDNIDVLKTWVPMFKGPIIGSTQVEPRPYVYNFGGFTDGDRALFIAYSLGVKKAVVGGMDFRGPIGRYSMLFRSKDVGIKMAKLEVAKKLISMLISLGMEVFSLSYTGIDDVEVL